ncbi:hypothetical protein EYF80_036014 [Liparis tanakae]|uniref:Uncharacterized protein n=1 Tax=Liparis tanakae TaxID=230148 RepID=A0A4Z2GJS3_9TELE|nr:hypothetical protein EYF80_036014 [Liparis tanakae]
MGTGEMAMKEQRNMHWHSRENEGRRSSAGADADNLPPRPPHIYTLPVATRRVTSIPLHDTRRKEVARRNRGRRSLAAHITSGATDGRRSAKSP